MQEGDFQPDEFFFGYHAGMKWNERLEIRMRELGMTMAELQRKTGLPYDSINKWLRGEVDNPRGSAIATLAKAVGVSEGFLRFGQEGEGMKIIPLPTRRKRQEHTSDTQNKVSRPDANPPSGDIFVLGEVAAGMWIDVRVADTVLERHPVSQLFVDRNYPIAAQYDLIVRGTSLNKIAPDGFHLRCVDVHKGRLEPVDGDLVIVRRMRDSYLCETTAKRYRVINGQKQLWPESTDERWQEAMVLPTGGEDGDESIDVVALVIHVYNPTLYRPTR